MNPNNYDGNDIIEPVSLPRIFIPPCFIDQPEVISQWRYEYRQLAQQIDTNLFLGPLSMVKDLDFLTENNIRVLISISDIRIVPAVVRHKYEPSGQFKCLSYDPGNKILSPMHLVSQLMEICQVVEEAERENVNVLIYCETGSNSSAVATAAYLIYKYDFDLIKAVQTVQARRFCAVFDDTARYNLCTFQDICKAHKPIKENPRGITKRPREREEDEEEKLQLTELLKTRQSGIKRRFD